MYGSIRVAALLVMAMMVNTATWAQLLTYTTDPAGNIATVAANATATSLTRVNGAATPGAPCGSGYSVSAFTFASVYSPGLAAVEVTLIPDAGFTLNMTGMSADLRRSAAGPASIRYAYSTDGGASWINQGTDQLPNNAACGITNTGTWTTSVAVPAPLQLRVRLYGYNATSASGTLQLLNLTVAGAVTASPACATPPGLSATLTTASSATLSWTAIPGALSYNIRYRPTGSSTWSFASSAGVGVILSSLLPGTVYECEAETVCPSGVSGYGVTSFFTTTAAGTASASSGKMVAYFNKPVDTTLSVGVNAVYLNNALDDTTIAYLSRAKYTIDIAQYNYNQSAGYTNLAAAINACVARGVRVRWIYDGNEANTGLALLNPAVRTLASPTTSSYGLMHNKFFVIDGNSSDPNDAIVSTGSTVWGVNQFNTDNNNTIFIQDSALAHAFLDQFHMMWGDTGTAPNPVTARFGPFKSDLGRHFFNIGGKTVELYFSPSDNTDAHIQSAINSANTDLYFSVYTFTMASCASAILARNTAGVYTPGIIDENSTISGAAYPMLNAGLGSLMKTRTGFQIHHHKTLIVDPSNFCSDPLVLTGSHNWTNQADTKNDENTLIIHSDTLANIYYQSFAGEYAVMGGTVSPIAPCATTTCGTPTGLSVTSVGTTTAILNWSMLPGALSYSIQYRPTGSTTWSSTTAATNSATLTGLTTATAYEYQVQAVCTAGSGSYSSSTTFTTLAPPCSVPTGLAVTGLDTNLAALSWVPVAGAVSYNVDYRITGATIWTTTTTSIAAITLTPLATATTYDWRVQVVCASGTSGYSAIAGFITDTVPTIPPPPPATCLAPAAAAIPATGITGTSATLHWQPEVGALGYNIRYHIAGTSGWLFTSSVTNLKSVTGLTPWATYEFQVQTICTGGELSAFSGSSLFMAAIPNGVATLQTDDSKSLAVYPNPTTGNISLQYYLSGGTTVSVSIYDIVGREVTTVVNSTNQGTGNYNYTATLPSAGVYYVRFTAGDYSITKRVVRM